MAENKPKVIIVGAGMAGLTAARTLPSALFDVSVLEAGNRIGGRICTSEFAGARIETGATWIHGIDGSPIHALAERIGALVPDPDLPWELMDGYPSDDISAVREGGRNVDPSVLHRVSSLYKTLKSRAAESPVRRCSVGSFLRSGLQAHLDSLGDGADADLEKSVFAIFEHIERTYTSADDLDGLDVLNETEYKEFPGEHITIPRGYSRLVEWLAAELPAGSVRLGRKVSRIDWSPAGAPVNVHVEDGEVLVADHVIVTVSLGVLKAGGLEFCPALPSDKAGAIGRLGFGVMDKVHVELEEPLPRVLLAFARREGSAESEGVPRWMGRTAGILPIYAGARVLHVWLAGKEAVEMEGLEEEEVVSGVQATIEAFGVGGDRPVRAVGMRRSGWAKDPLFMGSYSYLAVGSSGEDFDAVAEPVPGRYYGSTERPLQILFAGEATQRPYFSTTHGAYLSGIREAERLLQFYRRS